MKESIIFTLGTLSIICFCSLIHPSYTIMCTDIECYGKYEGPEFIDGSDIAPPFSNTMSAKVGDKLNELFRKGTYSKVDFDHIVMTTKGMGSGQVTYYLKIPFLQVTAQCEAYTSFDHVGGWNHTPALEARKKQLSKALLYKEKLDISKLQKTPEGLEEHWIQWKNKVTQSMCKK